MRIPAILFFFLIMTGSGLSQSASLTKGETIEYLNKKFKSTIGFELINSNGVVGKIVDAEFIKVGEDIRIDYTFEGKTSRFWRCFKFNPGRITDVTYLSNTTESSINEIFINLVGKVCVTTKGTGSYGSYATPTSNSSESYARILYLKADPDEFTKIKKALLYLKSLYKAEDDPFAN